MVRRPGVEHRGVPGRHAHPHVSRRRQPPPDPVRSPVDLTSDLPADPGQLGLDPAEVGQALGEPQQSEGHQQRIGLPGAPGLLHRSQQAGTEGLPDRLHLREPDRTTPEGLGAAVEPTPHVLEGRRDVAARPADGGRWRRARRDRWLGQGGQGPGHQPQLGAAVTRWVTSGSATGFAPARRGTGGTRRPAGGRPVRLRPGPPRRPPMTRGRRLDLGYHPAKGAGVGLAQAAGQLGAGPRGQNRRPTTVLTATPMATSSTRTRPTLTPTGSMMLKMMTTATVNPACPAANEMPRGPPRPGGRRGGAPPTAGRGGGPGPPGSASR